MDANVKDNPGTPLQMHLWRSYLRTALVPLLVIEVSFLAIYWISASYVAERNVATASSLSRLYFSDIAKREAGTIAANLEAVASHTRVFSRQTLAALEGNNTPPAADRDRYIIRPAGGLQTRPAEGATSSHYPSRVAIGLYELDKVLRLSALDPLMIATKTSNPSISAIYFNGFDNYNHSIHR